MHPAPRLPLTRLGEYELLRLIATGGSSEVYEARRTGPHGFSRRVAVKRILPQLASDLQFVQMFSDEARTHAGLDHPNLVAVLDFGEHGGELYMAMEYVDGSSLAETMGLDTHRVRLSLAPALRIAREILLGLSYVHGATDGRGTPLGLVHRDVAPSNILLSRTGEVKLTDFGIVRHAAAESRTMPGELRGMLGYVSPEQTMGARVDARSDLFSVGVVLAEMLMGEPLFPGRNELELLTQLHAGNLSALDRHPAEVPSLLKTFLKRLLAQRPLERFSSARETLEELDRVVLALGAHLDRTGLASYLSFEGTVPDASNMRMKAAPRVTVAVPSLRAGGMSMPAPKERPAPEPAIYYRVRRPGGTIVGPLTVARLLEMIATARAGLDSEVSRNEGPFMPLSAMTELAQVAARPAYRFFDPVALLATERHALVPWVSARQLLRMVREQRTGLLCSRSGLLQRRFYFVEGRLVASSSTEVDELLGSLLVAEGRLSAEVVEREVERGLRQGRSLGASLVHSGVLTEAEVTAMAHEQCIRRISRTVGQARGELFYIENARSGEAERSLAADGDYSLLVEAIRLGVSDLQAETTLDSAGDDALVLATDWPRLREELGLEPAEIAAIERAGGGKKVRALVRELAGSERSAALRGLFISLVSGALRKKRTR